MTKAKTDLYSFKEEVANSVTHGVGVVLGGVGLIFLLLKAIELNADPLTIVSMSIYGSSIIVLFLASTLYHAIPLQKAKRALKTFDHCAIFLLIAGSYTPFLLVSLRTPLAIGLMVAIWLIAIVGIIFKVLFVYRFKKLSLIAYLTMGWLSLIVIYQLALVLNVGGIVLLAAGGAAYTVGVLFYVANKIPFNHAIWHCFVLAGCLCHFLAIYFYVEPI